jgi:hypothetical protein
MATRTGTCSVSVPLVSHSQASIAEKKTIEARAANENAKPLRSVHSKPIAPLIIMQRNEIPTMENMESALETTRRTIAARHEKTEPAVKGSGALRIFCRRYPSII